MIKRPTNLLRRVLGLLGDVPSGSARLHEATEALLKEARRAAGYCNSVVPADARASPNSISCRQNTAA
ncbi:MAG: hypothetical protein ACUVTZ_08225 [Armatimonadota bacterium]